MLKVSAGSDFNSLDQINPNDSHYPINTKLFQGSLIVRIKDFDGLVPENKERISTLPYFNNKTRLLSLQVQGSFKEEINLNDLIWVTEWDHPINIPTFVCKMWAFMAPNAVMDLQAEKPYLKSFAILSACTFQAWDLNETPLPNLLDNTSDSESSNTDHNHKSKKLKPSLDELTEDIKAIVPDHLTLFPPRRFSLLGKHNPVDARRALYSHVENRESTIIKPHHRIAFDMYSPFFNVNNFSARIPGGISIDLNHVFCNQPFRMALRNVEGTITHVVVQLEIIKPS
ncbi:hypothetical protein BC833DRAFT_601661 [Globomyces pollinis-pini]|nr:hypothetical protein BC833DRAFT_601661 [Globomyces pollinis-pini]